MNSLVNGDKNELKRQFVEHIVVIWNAFNLVRNIYKPNYIKPPTGYAAM